MIIVTEELGARLVAAIKNNKSPAKIKALVTLGAPLDYTDLAGRTPLLLAAGNSVHPQVVKKLIAAGADVQKQHTMGELALDFAGRNENLVSTKAYELLRQKTQY